MPTIFSANLPAAWIRMILMDAIAYDRMMECLPFVLALTAVWFSLAAQEQKNCFSRLVHASGRASPASCFASLNSFLCTFMVGPQQTTGAPIQQGVDSNHMHVSYAVAA